MNRSEIRQWNRDFWEGQFNVGQVEIEQLVHENTQLLDALDAADNLADAAEKWLQPWTHADRQALCDALSEYREKVKEDKR